MSEKRFNKQQEKPVILINVCLERINVWIKGWVEYNFIIKQQLIIHTIKKYEWKSNIFYNRIKTLINKKINGSLFYQILGFYRIYKSNENI